MHKNKKCDDIFERTENIDLIMIQFLSLFVIKKKTPHIIIPLITFYSRITPFVNLVKDNYISCNNRKYNKFQNNFDNNKYSDTVCILISENINCDLLTFLTRNYKEMSLKLWKVIFFQIISVLAVIQKKYPTFRHNKLNLNNIYVCDVEHKSPAFYKYHLNEFIYFVIPYIGIQIKIANFHLSCISKIINNNKVQTKNISLTQNRYYDLHYFFNNLSKQSFFNNMPSEIKKFVNRTVPNQYKTGANVNIKGRLLTDDEFTNPYDVLRFNSLFDEFRY